LILSTRGVGSKEDDIVGREGPIGSDGLVINGELIGGEGAGLVRAKNGNTSQLLNGSDTSNNSFVFGKLLGTNGEGNRKHSRHSNGNTTNQENKDIVETAAVVEAETGVKNENLCNNEDTDRDKTKGSDLSKNLLQVASGIIILTDKRGSTTKESVGASGDDNTLSLTLFTDGAPKDRFLKFA